MMSVVHPAYHCAPKGGHGSFLPSASRLLSCDLVFATAHISGQFSGDGMYEDFSPVSFKTAATQTHIRRDR